MNIEVGAHTMLETTTADGMTPLVRAIDVPGECCVCGKRIPISEIRCWPHLWEYLKAVKALRVARLA